mmetsp:Transcript_39107/g.59651  ORF Transcript_39107/g.59651 Transcript_39107/m.59651 type:complete len:121 (-) Transcript_39107:650-1012(-)
MIEEAEAKGLLSEGTTIYEGSGGNTGTALALISSAKGYKAFVTVADITSEEKIRALKALGANVQVCPNVDYTSEFNYVNVAKQKAILDPNGLFLDQFSNSANAQAHKTGTGPEIWAQSGG